MPAGFRCFLPGGVVLAFSLTAMQPAIAQTTPQQSLLVLSKHDHALSIVDPATLKVIAHAPVGQDPHEVIASSDGKTAYVSIYGGGAFHVLSVIDLVGQKALPDIDLGALNGPHGLTFVGGKLWFTAEGAKAIGSYDPASGKIDWIMGTGQNRTHMIYVTADQKQIYTTNVASATVSILEKTARPPMAPPPPPKMQHGPGAANGGPGGPGLGPGMNGPPQMDWTQTVIPVGKGDEGFDVSPDGRELWTADAQDGTISIVDIPGKKVVATLPAKVFGANRLKFTTDGKLALISSLRDADLVIYDTSSRKEVKRVKIGHGAAGILMQPDGARAFISCGPDNYVAVLDLKTLEVTGHIDAGGEPDGLAWAVQQ
ncbi:beta-propeller fold lactonase family protein [Acidicapsa acidisoli]|uniref:YncE family protein n=1 Tax=Acidicapsa acidisoli TaxID=1615681 RepID=UPI0021E0811A|nr:YncE family protein [Acidicapsa acidisoli]